MASESVAVDTDTDSFDGFFGIVRVYFVVIAFDENIIFDENLQRIHNLIGFYNSFISLFVFGLKKLSTHPF